MDIKIDNNSTPPPSSTMASNSTTPKKIEEESKPIEQVLNVDENNKKETKMEDEKKDDGMETNGGVPSAKDNDADKKCILSNVDSSSGKRRLSINEQTNCDVKKAKLDLESVGENVETTITSTNITDVVVGNGNATADDSDKPSTNNGQKKSDEKNDGDDLLERLDAIDASSLRKPDLKLDEIDSTDLEKDDLLKRLEEAENGLEGVSSSGSAGTSSAKIVEDKTENVPVCDSSVDKVETEKSKEITPTDSSKANDENLLYDNEATDLHTQETAVIKSPDKPTTTAVVSKSDSEPPSTDDDVKISMDKEQAMDIDNLGASDSTVSINSATEEIIINFSKETTKMDEDENIVPDSSKTITVKDKKMSNVMMEMNNASSTPNSNNSSVVGDRAVTTAAVVFNSTPIEKNFEISSENVSHISASGANDVVGTTSETPVSTPKVTASAAAADVTSAVKVADVIAPVVKSESDTSEDVTMADTTDSKSEDIDTSESVSDAHSSDDKITQYAKKIKELNGVLGSSPLDDKKPVVKPVEPSSSAITSSEPSDEGVYEVRLWCEKDDIKYLSVERMDTKVTTVQHDLTDSADSTGEKSSSNGSVGSLGPFTLPSVSAVAQLSSISSNTSSSIPDEIKLTAKTLPPNCITKSIHGVNDLCNFIIDKFTEIKRKNEKLNPAMLDISTPKARGRGAADKKNLSKIGMDAEDEPKSAGGRKRGSATANSKTPTPVKADQFLVPPTNSALDHGKVGVIVLAKWVDRMYYAGKVIECRPGNKFVVRFEDGKKKTLSPDAIVFGDEEVLPLIDQAVHAMVGNEEYETGLVTSYDIENGTTYYTVICETMTVKVTSADLYLTDEQAKTIQNIYKDTSSTGSPGVDDSPADGKRPHRSSMARTEATIAAFTKASGGRGGRSTSANKADPKTPEAGFSGGVVTGKRGRRGRRPQQTQSESSDISDNMETDSMPNSPDSALEAIDGVQPELQKTPKESQINKMCIMAEYLGSKELSVRKDIEEILGPRPTNKRLFRKKYFILTCTISMRQRSNNAGDTSIKDDSDDLTNKYKKFTTLPFIKDHLCKQIEEGGGEIFHHFEDIPKAKYKQCKLIAPHPCVTAKYIQCLAAEIPAISHEWIIECCNKGVLVDTKPYVLPSGWSIVENRYIKWSIGRAPDQRSASNSLSNQVVLMASQNKDFNEFWSRVCKLAGATTRFIKVASDITKSMSGYMLTDEEFPQEIKSKAEHFGVPIVSTVWVAQSLIVGRSLKPDAHQKLKETYFDDDYY